MVASAHPLASGAGLQVLQQGGNAIDAAVATAAALNVVEPYMSGIAGDGYMLIYTAKDRQIRVLDYMGPSSKAATHTAFSNYEEMRVSPKSPLVPGSAAGWLTALETHGTLDRAAVFAPAIALADDGAPLTVRNAVFFQAALDVGNLTQPVIDVFMPGGVAPGAGSVVKQPLLAQTFRKVVEGGKDEFYRGDTAREIVRSMTEQGGWLSEEDLATYEPVWKEPVSISYRGYEINCPPPPCSGIQYLESLNLLESYDVGALGHNSVETLHAFAESIKLALADRVAYVAHPRRRSMPPSAGRRSIPIRPATAKANGTPARCPIAPLNRARRTGCSAKRPRTSMLWMPRGTRYPLPKVSARRSAAGTWRATPGWC
jgi:gamma-glutamyltranspeptidase/glutathione hydrolase